MTGKTIGGLSLFPEKNRFDRAKALELYIVGSSWFSTEDGKKGSLAQGQFADLAVLSSDYFSIPEEEIKNLESVLTIALFAKNIFPCIHLISPVTNFLVNLPHTEVSIADFLIANQC